MRAMLISLIFFYSLIQLAIGDGESTVNKISFPDCGSGKKYVCYVPQICTVPKVPGKSLKDYKVTIVDETTEVYEDCSAIIRYHMYTKSWMYVWIESYQAITDDDSIEFLHTDNKYPTPNKKTKLSCTHDKPNNKIVGKYEDEEKYSVSANPLPKLNCSFEIKRQGGEEIFSTESNDNIFINVRGVKTLVFPGRPDTATNCDPSFFNFEDEYNQKTIYEEVKYSPDKPGEYTCKNSIYKMQYRKDESAEYSIAEKIECDRGNFVIKKPGSDADIISDEYFDIRCFAETKLLCKYKVKEAGGGKTPVEGPNMDDTIESELKCGAKPHLIIVHENDEKPFRNPKFECLHLGGDPVWKVEGEILTKTGPRAYCTDEVDCNFFFTISDSSVINGLVDPNDFLPKCFETGTMYVEKVMKGNEVKSVKCDRPSGNFKYSVGSDESIIKEHTKFICDYPKNEAVEEKNKKNEKTILYGSLTVGGVCFGLTLVVCCILWYCCRRCNKKQADKANMVNNAAWLLYAADVHERKMNNNKPNKTKRKKTKETPTLVNALGKTESWNIMQMSTRIESMNVWAPDDGSRVPLLKTEINTALFDTPENVTAGRELVKLSKDEEEIKIEWKKLKLDYIHKKEAYCDALIKSGRPDPQKNK